MITLDLGISIVVALPLVSLAVGWCMAIAHVSIRGPEQTMDDVRALAPFAREFLHRRGFPVRHGALSYDEFFSSTAAIETIGHTIAGTIVGWALALAVLLGNAVSWYPMTHPTATMIATVPM